MPSSTSARIFLGLNAAFSLTVGLILLFAAESAAEVLFAETANWQPTLLRFLGAGLLIFACDLFLMASNRFISRGQVLLISGMDAGWVLGSIFLLAFGGDLFSNSGVMLIEIVALFVAIFAIGQYVGAGKIEPLKSRASVRATGGKLHASVKRVVNAPVDAVWAVMTDHPRYADVASNISKVEVLSGDGLGMERRCYGPKGENWRETCDLFEDGKVFGFKIHTEAEDYPYPMSDLQGRWTVEPKRNGSEFSIDIEAKPTGNFVVQTLFKLAAKRQFKAILIDLADAWSARMEREASR